MEKCKYLILGGGPAGLSFACTLKNRGEMSFLLLEKESEAGGLCRSVSVGGFPVDIGGGHFLDKRSRRVLDFLLAYMPVELWNSFQRDSQIFFDRRLMGSPFEAHLWQLSVDRQVEYIRDIAAAGCNRGAPMPEKFVDWIRWKLGAAIARDYMLPYNTKMFGSDLDSLGTYWLAKLPNVSFEDTLRSCLERRFYGQQPCHAEFLYPKEFGYGELWLRMARELDGHFRPDTAVRKLDFSAGTVNDAFQADVIVTTIPWLELEEIAGMPEELVTQLRRLRYSSVQIEHFDRSLPYETDAQWIYYPSPDFSYHRILVMDNFVPDCHGYWTETNLRNVRKKLGKYRYVNQYAYPLNTVEKPEIIGRLLKWAAEMHVYGLGRWGEWQHYNSDVVVERAIDLANRL